MLNEIHYTKLICSAVEKNVYVPEVAEQFWFCGYRQACHALNFLGGGGFEPHFM